MQADGFEYDSIWDSYADPNIVVDDGPPSPSEVQAAVRDVRCKNQVNLIGIWTAVESAYQAELIEESPDLVRRLRSETDRLLEFAD